jgi:hypothetical protein
MPTKPRTDPRVSQVERGDRFCGVWAGGKIQLGGARAEGAEVRRVGEAGARRRASVCEKSDGDQTTRLIRAFLDHGVVANFPSRVFTELITLISGRDLTLENESITR